MPKKINKKEFSELMKKINENTATPEEKLKLLKTLNSYIEKSNSLVENLVDAMKQQIEKSKQ